MAKTAILVLEDGSVYEGYTFGAEGDTIGEAVFNTSMAGYQEMLTDPSYAGQIVVPTYPLIGNYGTNEEDFESNRIQVKGFVVREACVQPSHYLNNKTLHDYLTESGIVTAKAAAGERIRSGDPAAVISQAALADECPACVRALDMFLSAYGAAAGNLALAILATGGVYVGGGIAPKLWPTIADGRFREGFVDKGRFRSVLEGIPVRMINNPQAALRGAARRAGVGRAGSPAMPGRVRIPLSPLAALLPSRKIAWGACGWAWTQICGATILLPTIGRALHRRSHRRGITFGISAT